MLSSTEPFGQRPRWPRPRQQPLPQLWTNRSCLRCNSKRQIRHRCEFATARTAPRPTHQVIPLRNERSIDKTNRFFFFWRFNETVLMSFFSSIFYREIILEQMYSEKGVFSVFRWKRRHSECNICVLFLCFLLNFDVCSISFEKKSFKFRRRIRKKNIRDNFGIIFYFQI